MAFFSPARRWDGPAFTGGATEVARQVRSVNQFLAGQQAVDLLAEKLRRVQLIAHQLQPHPDDVKMIGHQAIDRAEQMILRARVDQHFAELSMESLIQPAGRARLQGVRPEDDGEVLVFGAIEPGQVVAVAPADGTLSLCQRAVKPVATAVKPWPFLPWARGTCREDQPRLHRRYGSLVGNRRVKVLPLPSLLSTETLPACASTMAFTMDKPRPAPPCVRVRAVSTR